MNDIKMPKIAIPKLNLTTEEADRIRTAINNFVEAVKELFQRLVKTFVRYVKENFPALMRWIKIKSHRYYKIAAYHNKSRIRKKYYKKIMEEVDV